MEDRRRVSLGGAGRLTSLCLAGLRYVEWGQTPKLLRQPATSRETEGSRAALRMAARPGGEPAGSNGPRGRSLLLGRPHLATTGGLGDERGMPADAPLTPHQVAVAQLHREARALEAAGDFDMAFSVFQAAADLTAAHDAASPDEGERLRRLADARMRKLLTPQYIEEVASPFALAPIFIVGMPRSGSTLVEQILACHPDVEAIGEADKLSDIVSKLRVSPPFPSGMAAQLRAEYLASLPRKGFGVFTDKTLGTFNFLGAVKILFPNAIILNCVRPAMATCWSCFTTPFGVTQDYCVSLPHLGREYVRYRAMIDHWRGFIDIVDVSHEVMVSDTETEIRRLLAACGLPWHDACLRFYENDRGVRTASKDQVRRPIFDSNDRWRNYEKHLGPLIEALGPHAQSISA